MPKYQLTITLSHQATDLLRQIAERGLWGRTREEVAARLVDAGLQQFVNPVRYGVAVEPRGQRKGERD